MKNKYQLIYFLLFVLALAVNLAAINVKFFTDDPGLYAAIAKDLYYKREFLELFTYNMDWLDKPHFPFWMAAISFRIFGISVWAYRLPAFLFFLLSLLYTYLFSRKYYGKETAAIAVMILMMAQYIIMSNTDVRAEPYLMALVIGSIYHISLLEERYKATDLILAALLTACAIMTKGIFVLVAIYGSLMVQLLFQRNFKKLFSRTFIGLYALTLVFTLPEFYALYKQFDAHPEKLVFGRHNVSGIKWFLWDSQFGRFTNSGPINRAKGGGDIFFYVHTLLWAFAPWCLLFYYAIDQRLNDFVKKNPVPEYYTFGGALLLLLLFSLSGFQLPFYTNTVFPLFAVITAPYCFKNVSKLGNIFRYISHWLYVIVFVAAVFVLNYYLKPPNPVFLIVDCMVFVVLILLSANEAKEPREKMFFLVCSSALFANFYLATNLYPMLASYNGQNAAAAYINQPEFDDYNIYSARTENNVFQFECKHSVHYVPVEEFLTVYPKTNAVFYMSQYSLNYLIENHIPYRILQSFQNYSQERILPQFVNSATRNKVLDSVYLVTPENLPKSNFSGDSKKH